MAAIDRIEWLVSIWLRDWLSMKNLNGNRLMEVMDSEELKDERVWKNEGESVRFV